MSAINKHGNKVGHFCFAATTEVSWATVLEGARHVMITCHFVPGSKAKGCFVQIRLVSTSPKVLYISRLPGSHFVTQCVHLPPNSPTKSFSIRDWKFDGSTGPLSVTTYIDVRQKPPCKNFYFNVKC